MKEILLHNIRSIHNVGSFFRTSDAVGVDKIYLSGYTPTPTDRFGRERSDLEKTALGAEKIIPWEKIEDVKGFLNDKKQQGFEIASVEQDEKSVDYKEFSPKEKILVIFGEEVNGIEKELLDLSDVIIEIPMKGQKESLNVSVAGGIILYRLFDKTLK